MYWTAKTLAQSLSDIQIPNTMPQCADTEKGAPMPNYMMIPVANLLVDEQNPRLGQTSNGQRETIRSLAEAQGSKLQAMAEDIVENGLNPGDLTMVVPLAGDSGQYVVLDGNRRLTALRALESPDIIAGAVPLRVLNAIRKISSDYHSAPIDNVQCVVFNERAEADHWIELWHTGERGGAGHVPWGSDESDRFRARKGQTPNRATQALDFLQNRGAITVDQRSSVDPSTLDRMLSSPVIRNKLGLDYGQGTLYATGDPNLVSNGLTYLVNEMIGGRLDVTRVYTGSDREQFADEIPAGVVVPQITGRSGAVPLHEADSQQPTKRKRTRRTEPKLRDHLIPNDCVLHVSDPRIQDIEKELRKLSLSGTPNAVGVLFRVFIELSVDSYISRENLTMPKEPVLRSKLNKVADNLITRQMLTNLQAAPVRRAASKDSFLGPSTALMNQWVHNQHMSPVGSELRSHWNDLQPFVTAIWAP